LKARDLVEAQSVEFFGHDFHRRAGHDKGDDLLASIGVRAADNRDLDEVGMTQQDLLHLARIYVAAAADDHVLGAVAQGQKPLLVKAAQIAGVQPAASQGFLAEGACIGRTNSFRWGSGDPMQRRAFLKIEIDRQAHALRADRGLRSEATWVRRRSAGVADKRDGVPGIMTAVAPVPMIGGSARHAAARTDA
jgi:hypothetical protein